MISLRRLAISAPWLVAAIVGSPAAAADPPQCLTAPVEGQRLKKAGQLLAARARFVACARETCPANVATACTRWANDLDASIPTIVLGARDDRGQDLTDVEVSVDGGPASPLGVRAVELDPGVHRVVFRRPAAEDVEQEIVVREGEKNRAVVATFAIPDAGPPLVVAAPQQPSWWTPMRTGAAITAGAGAAALVTGFALALVAKIHYDDARSSCAAPDACPHDAVTRSDAARSLATGATFVIAAGAAVAAAGGVLILVSPSPSSVALRAQW